MSMDRLSVTSVDTLAVPVAMATAASFTRCSAQRRQSWICRVQRDRRRDIGLGSVVDVNLAEARERAIPIA
ncbi:hypothetical protein [Sphingopyxis sp.]|uniref:hypothetical protein n=1 Tax=Sphingopyxis sp. TaxID=1908224 RepID=UPI0025E3C8B1|nr:hypothetical protein [Sphingopyxis sp.]MBK6414120.1 DUF4102 domain-containing protein [Sphingopyxis sp.]